MTYRNINIKQDFFDFKQSEQTLRPNPSPWMGDKVDSGIGLSMVNVLESILEWT
jgi:hypothetical protein